MSLYRLYPCDPDQVDRRLDQLIQSVPCVTACGTATSLQTGEATEAVALDERFEGDPLMVKAVEEFIAEGKPVYLFEVWCRYKQARCPHPSSCKAKLDPADN